MGLRGVTDMENIKETLSTQPIAASNDETLSSEPVMQANDEILSAQPEMQPDEKRKRAMQKTLKIVVRVLTYIILTFGAVLLVFPYLWMVLSSFKTVNEANSVGGRAGRGTPPPSPSAPRYPAAPAPAPALSRPGRPRVLTGNRRSPGSSSASAD